MANKIIPDATDAAPVTHGVLREMRDRIYDLENRLAFNTSDQAAGNKGIDATTQALSLGVNELSSRRVMGNEEVYDQTISVGTAMPWTGPVLAPVTFKIDKPRLVRVDLSAYVSFTLPWTGTGGAPQISIQHHFNWGGVNIGTYSPYGQASYVASGVNSGFSGSNRVSFFDLVNLKPATYTVAYCPVLTALNGSSGSARFQNPRILVQILEPLEGF